MILVTGSEGFIGRNLVAKLKEQDKEVLEFDIKHHRPEEIYTLFEIPKIKLIYHLGAISSTLETNLDLLYRHNVEFSIDLFNMAISHRIPVVYTTSASVFGNTMKDEKYIYNPLNYYATTKMLTEMWLFQNRSKFHALSVPRLFNVYGADERKADMSTSPICKFTQQAKETGVITLFKGSHNMIRDFVAIEDVLEVLIDLKKFGFYDVGTCEPISFQDVAEMIADKYNATIKYVPMPDKMKPSYQYYTKARQNVIWYQSVEKWIKSQ
jgi:ADP-L-glycero-D-manno-heptose 6-epimerase